METATKKMVNGFKKEEIKATLSAIQANPEIAKFKFRTTNNWLNAGHNRATVKGFFGGCQEDTTRKDSWHFDLGEPPILLGNNEGANPVEYLLTALSGCMTTTMVLHAAAREMEIESIESTFEGDLDVQGFLGLNKDVRNGYQQIKVRFDIKGNLTEEQKQELIDFALESPVYDVVSNGTKVGVSLA